jgi:hypothetical protein
MGKTMTLQDAFFTTLFDRKGADLPSFIVDPATEALLEPDDSIEFHASRLLVLLMFCGLDLPGKQAIRGRTKLAKLDFLLRYPSYLYRALQTHGRNDLAKLLEESEIHNIEASMIRYKYGPWDSKYYDVFAYLSAKGLLEVVPKAGVDLFILTEQGVSAVNALLQDAAFQKLKDRCIIVRRVFGRWSGETLKTFIYRSFPEIVQQSLGSTIF